MAAYVAGNILDSGDDQETGNSALFKLIDELFVEAYENGEDWLAEIED